MPGVRVRGASEGGAVMMMMVILVALLNYRGWHVFMRVCVCVREREREKECSGDAGW